MSSSMHADNKKKDVLILLECPAQGLNDTTVTAEKSVQLISLKIIKKFKFAL